MIAVLGYGAWGRNLARNFAALGRLGAIVDIGSEARGAVRSAALAVPVASSLGAIADDARISAVAIATPAETHVALCHEALDRGLDVFCEKPLALRYSDAERLARRAAADHRVLMVGHILEYHPGIRALLRVVAEGVLGEIRQIHTSRLHPPSGRDESSTLWTLAPHDIAVILRVLGRRPTSVTAVGTSDGERGGPGEAALRLRFSGGVDANVRVSSVHHCKEQRIVVVGSQRTALFDDVEDRLTLHEANSNPAVAVAGVLGSDRRIDFPSDEPLRLECEAFIDALQTRSPPRTDARSALEVLRVIEQAHVSILANEKHFDRASSA